MTEMTRLAIVPSCGEFNADGELLGNPVMGSRCPAQAE